MLPFAQGQGWSEKGSVFAMIVVKRIGLIIATLGILWFLDGSLSRVHADTYYGNGVYCNKHTCHVDWGKAWSNIFNNSAANWFTGGHAGWHE